MAISEMHPIQKKVSGWFSIRKSLVYDFIPETVYK